MNSISTIPKQGLGIPRRLTGRLLDAVSTYPVACVTGPRQSGKTTLVRQALPDWAYVNLEAPDWREYAVKDPRGLLAEFEGPVIFDEAQRVPDLFSYIQVTVDERGGAGHFVLTGSHNFLLLESISQSLAGRAAILHLLPFSLGELHGHEDPVPGDLPASAVPQIPEASLEEVLYTGFYPPVHDRGLVAGDWLAAYYQTYVERDVRTVVNVGDLDAFGRFVRLCAGRAGQLLNLSSLAADCGVTHTTAKRWLSVLEASFLVTQLRPHHRNFGKRLVKRPKLYFTDTGLLCYLLGLRTADELRHHHARGAVFESFVVAEVLKAYLHRGERPDLHFWRDSAGHEVDLLIEADRRTVAVEVKSGATLASDSLDGLHYWQALSSAPAGSAALVYGGPRPLRREGVAVLPWYVL